MSTIMLDELKSDAVVHTVARICTSLEIGAPTDAQLDVLDELVCSRSILDWLAFRQAILGMNIPPEEAESVLARSVMNNPVWHQVCRGGFRQTRRETSEQNHSELYRDFLAIMLQPDLLIELKDIAEDQIRSTASAASPWTTIINRTGAGIVSRVFDLNAHRDIRLWSRFNPESDYPKAELRIAGSRIVIECQMLDLFQGRRVDALLIDEKEGCVFSDLSFTHPEPDGVAAGQSGRSNRIFTARADQGSDCRISRTVWRETRDSSLVRATINRSDVTVSRNGTASLVLTLPQHNASIALVDKVLAIGLM